MVERIEGKLVSLEGPRAILQPASWPMQVEVLLPTFLAIELAPLAGQQISFVTYFYLEGVGQGSSFVPRVLGFRDASQREFFQLLTDVSGIGNRKALRMLAWKPSQVARAIADRDAKALATLPEVGKRVAEKIIAELDGKVEKFLGAQSPSGVEPKPTRAGALGPVAEDAVAALIALGQSRDEAVKSVEVALARRGKALAPASVQELVEAVFRVGA